MSIRQPSSKSEFVKGAEAVTIIARRADGTEVVLGRAEPREFSSGSVGWYLNAKAAMTFNGGAQCVVQCGANLVVAKSKDLPA